MRVGALALVALGLASPAWAQNATAGARVFSNQCKACHAVGEGAKNGIGPELNGLFGRKAGSAPGYKYSSVNESSGIVWDDTDFASYIRDPQAAMPGTKMMFAGLKSDKQGADLRAYLHQFGADGTKPP